MRKVLIGTHNVQIEMRLDVEGLQHSRDLAMLPGHADEMLDFGTLAHRQYDRRQLDGLRPSAENAQCTHEISLEEKDQEATERLTHAAAHNALRARNRRTSSDHKIMLWSETPNHGHHQPADLAINWPPAASQTALHGRSGRPARGNAAPEVAKPCLGPKIFFRQGSNRFRMCLLAIMQLQPAGSEAAHSTNS